MYDMYTDVKKFYMLYIFINTFYINIHIIHSYTKDTLKKYKKYIYILVSIC